MKPEILDRGEALVSGAGAANFKAAYAALRAPVESCEGLAHSGDYPAAAAGVPALVAACLDFEDFAENPLAEIVRRPAQEGAGSACARSLRHNNVRRALYKRAELLLDVLGTISVEVEHTSPENQSPAFALRFLDEAARQCRLMRQLWAEACGYESLSGKKKNTDTP